MKNNNQPKVSIVIPVYNGSNFLKEAIDSALAQTYKNIEIIVVNDGSNDKGATEKIAKSYGNKIKYFSKTNGGVSTALNLGIKRMTGDYMSWLSHDDIMYPNKIERQINFINSQTNKNIIIYANYALLKDGKLIPVILHHEMLERKPKYSLLRGSVNGITLLIPKTIIDDIGFFDESLKYTQDYDYWMRVQNKYKFIHMDEIVSVTRIHRKQDSYIPSKVVEEGNKLWGRLIQWIDDSEKKSYEFTLYNFYFEMTKFLKTTPYRGAEEFCHKQLLDNDVSDIIKDFDFKISIVIPFYNRINETIRAVDSCLRQTYKNIEILLINDASTTNINPLNQFIKNHKNIIMINLKNNSGAAAARNIGIKQSSGKYIAFLDSDDWFKKDKVRFQISEMMIKNTNMSYTSYVRKNKDEEYIMSGHDVNGIVIPKIISSCPIATPTVIVRRSFLTKNKIYFKENFRIGEDTCFWLEVAKYTDILYIDKPMTIVNSDSSSSAYDNYKLQTGFKNILSYLTNDSFYSQYSHEIALLSRDFAIIDQKIMLQKSKELELPGYNKVSLGEFVISLFSKTFSYRIIRKIHRDGFHEAVRLIKEKLKR